MEPRLRYLFNHYAFFDSKDNLYSLYSTLLQLVLRALFGSLKVSPYLIIVQFLFLFSFNVLWIIKPIPVFWKIEFQGQSLGILFGKSAIFRYIRFRCFFSFRMIHLFRMYLRGLIKYEFYRHLA